MLPEGLYRSEKLSKVQCCLPIRSDGQVSSGFQSHYTFWEPVAQAGAQLNFHSFIRILWGEASPRPCCHAQRRTQWTPVPPSSATSISSFIRRFSVTWRVWWTKAKQKI